MGEDDGDMDWKWHKKYWVVLGTLISHEEH